MDYAVEVLFPVIPVALRSGLGPSQIDRIRKLDKMTLTFLNHRQREQTVLEEARRWFLACLGQYDGEYLALDPVRCEIEAHLAEICGESIAKVRADFDFIEQHGAPGPDAPPALAFNPPEPPPKPSRMPTGAPSPCVSMVDDETSGAKIGRSERPDTRAAEAVDDFDGKAFDFKDATPGEPADVRPPASPLSSALTPSPRQNDLPQDVKSLRGRMWTLATQLAQRHSLGECILTCTQGCGFLVDLP
jgi:hypothetical protein